MQLYRASDRLFKNKELIEEKIFSRVQDVFSFTPTITLCDLTKTYKQRNGKTLQVRQATPPERVLGDIYAKRKINPNPGGLKKMTI
jgi:hypothetical protein